LRASGQDPEAAHGWYHGIRLPGTNVSGVITAGTFYQDGKRLLGAMTGEDDKSSTLIWKKMRQKILAHG
jgi:hypothetical protein